MEENSLIEDVEYVNDKNEEDPILVAQRYLNIFHQIHIFNSTRKAEFDNSLLDMPEKIKKITATLPGGRILLEHIQEIEERQGMDSTDAKELMKESNDAKSEEDAKKALIAHKNDQTVVNGSLNLSENFADSLAQSLALALKSNNIIPQASNALPPIAQPTLYPAEQNQIQPISAISTQGNSTDKLASNGSQQNTQNNNNASATTINNINMDYSFINLLADTLRKNNERSHEDIMKIVETLNQSFTPTIVKADGIPLSVITNSISQALKDTGKQQIEAMKAYGETLARSILQSQQMFAQNLPQSSALNNTMPKSNVINSEPAKSAQSPNNNVIHSTNSSNNVAGTTKPNATKTASSTIEKPQTSVANKTNSSIKTSNSKVENNITDLLAEDSKPIDLNTRNQSYGSALQKIKEALSDNTTKIDLKDVKPVSLDSTTNVESSFKQPAPKPQVSQQSVKSVAKPVAPKTQPLPQKSEPVEEISLDDDDEFAKIFSSSLTDNNTSTNNDEDWEYVDENDVSGSDDEWEYVDEDGNPISDDEGEWEYVDENGNIVDENGNPLPNK